MAFQPRRHCLNWTVASKQAVPAYGWRTRSGPRPTIPHFLIIRSDAGARQRTELLPYSDSGILEPKRYAVISRPQKDLNRMNLSMQATSSKPGSNEMRPRWTGTVQQLRKPRR